MILFVLYYLDLSFTELIDGLTMMSRVAAALIGSIGVLIMAYGAAKGLLYFILFTYRGDDLLIEVRIELAKHLSLGLEFLVAKDIIDTIVRPAGNQVFYALFTLAGIVLIRTFISHMLSHEISSAAAEIADEANYEAALEQFENKQQAHKHKRRPSA
jgi:uncharacterized membrane protein